MTSGPTESSSGTVHLDPAAALQAVERSLRRLVVQVLGHKEWLLSKGHPEEQKLRRRQAEEKKRRAGTLLPESLIEYTNLCDLVEILDGNWPKFAGVFRDKGRTIELLRAADDLRNAVAHSRPLLPYEQCLLSGIAGDIRNQVTIFRTKMASAGQYYPLIEDLTDGHGLSGYDTIDGLNLRTPMLRLDVGTILTFSGSAAVPEGKRVAWYLDSSLDSRYSFIREEANGSLVASGDDVRFDMPITEKHVTERMTLRIRIISDSKYHRHSSSESGLPYDDERFFIYAVNPPSA